MLRLGLALVLALAWLPARAADKAGDFEFYVLALSWNASWCAREGDARDAPQCDARHDLGFTLHGLWPQRTRDWPEFCRSRHTDPSRAQSRTMTDIMGSPGLAWHQWKKHGRCADLPAMDYFDLARNAYRAVNRPKVLRKLDREVKVDPRVVEQAFLEANPALSDRDVVVTCRDGYLQEVRICLSKSLEPRACPSSVRACSARSVTLPPMR